ncbi:hypothetical protein MPTK1_3g15250 [Marchantia polymorpha subsp. ruderalis]|uniref:Uncharacterized protein n=2 Tax=Marchantia polymorpha TaxID=3197 RepID=A0AAF6B112_MARPO|nr:hypothetical protein MARPO_0004s0147 [Marchantia polymorpha]BBN05696.1 hypothetical protein Mp_3g15250 [Marchantia polymorpha subsp. ruderalis]|eukprot:PTQ48885.1 hypothetical protein MARPO_0004s0147 [Marchantia polymorpha]
MSSATQTQAQESLCLTPQLPRMSSGADRNSRSSPVRRKAGILIRRRAEKDDAQSRMRQWMETDDTCVVFDAPPLYSHSFHVSLSPRRLASKGKALIHEDDIPPGFGFIAKQRNMRRCGQTQLQVQVASCHRPVEESSLMERCESNAQASRLGPPDCSSRVKESSNPDDELKSTASCNKHWVGLNDSEDDASSVHNVDSGDDDSHLVATSRSTSD